MSVKRRDSKNRVLRDGESQRKDGRYAYVYTDGNGNQKFLYSWKLEETDRLPAGRRNCESLRSKVKRLKKDLDDGINLGYKRMTVLELVKKYIDQKQGVAANTKAVYGNVVKTLENDVFGDRRIDRVKTSDAKEWFVKLKINGKSYNTIRSIRNVVKPAFQMAVDDDLIHKNPFEFPPSTVISNDSIPGEAITEDQEKRFLEFLKHDEYYRRYYDVVYILFNTGLRISELAGLTISDIDFKNNTVSINHQLLWVKVGDSKKLLIGKPKSRSGTRKIPMTKGVAESFMRIVRNRIEHENDVNVDGVDGFLFLRKDGRPVRTCDWYQYFTSMQKRYNASYGEQLKITPHVCRHTFCSKMARRGMNPKMLQYIMGHSDVGITLNTYAHIQYEDAAHEMNRICMV